MEPIKPGQPISGQPMVQQPVAQIVREKKPINVIAILLLIILILNSWFVYTIIQKLGVNFNDRLTEVALFTWNSSQSFFMTGFSSYFMNIPNSIVLKNQKSAKVQFNNELEKIYKISILTEAEKKEYSGDTNLKISMDTNVNEFISMNPSWMVDSERMTSLYGYRLDPMKNQGGQSKTDFHPGMDIGCPTGTKVYASLDGIVSIASYDRGDYGTVVLIKHKNGFTTVYGHLSKILVKPGQKVVLGQNIALSGNTGKSTGDHLHFEIRRGEELVDVSLVGKLEGWF